MLTTVLTGCDRSQETDAPPLDAYDIREAPVESLATPVDSLPAGPILPPEPVALPEPDAIATEADTAWVAMPEELAELSARLVVPVQGVARSELRDSYDEARGATLHEALDILAPRGTPVLSAADGRVLRLFDSRPGGLMVYATDPSERFILFYGHLDAYAAGLSDGMPLERGQVIGYVGTTGNAPEGTPHLHFGILRGNPSVSWSDGVPVNPYPLLVYPGR
jgi:peptidoglycan LD-endopeptidase LytH